MDGLDCRNRLGVRADCRVSEHDDDRWGIGLSLSGGGHRATLAAIGAMVALVDSGANRDVRWVASVSGGSIANAFVATQCAFREVTDEQFELIARRAISHVVDRGSLMGTKAAKVRLATAGAALTVSLALAARSARSALRSSDKRRAWHCVTAGGWSLVAALVVHLRGWLVERSIGELWCRDAEGRPSYLIGAGVDESSWTSEAWDRAHANHATPAEHVFAASDLRAGGAVYFAQEFIVSNSRARAMRRFSLARAVRASASLPGALPPVPIDVGRHTCSPRGFGPAERVLAVDGGVYNNLASGWGDRGSRGDSDMLFSDLSRQPAVDLHVILDAGKPLSESWDLLHRLPVIRTLYTLRRAVAVSYEAGLEGRRETLGSGWPETGRTRWDPARRVAVKVPGVPVSARQALPDHLKLSKPFWRLACGPAKSLPTTLRRLRRAEATALVVSGYVGTMHALSRAGLDISGVGRMWVSWLRDEVLQECPGAKVEYEKALEFEADIRKRRQALGPEPGA